MGGCGSMSKLQGKEQSIVRRRKITQQKDENKQPKEDQFYLGNNLQISLNIKQYDEYLEKSNSQSKQKVQKLFRPLYKNFILTHQETFPNCLLNDEEFRLKQMQQFIQKCQEISLQSEQEGEDQQSVDDSVDNNNNNSSRQSGDNTKSNHKQTFIQYVTHNYWIHKVICKAEIKARSQIYLFKRRYFEDFNRLSAFLSYQLQLKRLQLQNLLTFFFINVGSVNYKIGNVLLEDPIQENLENDNNYEQKKNEIYFVDRVFTDQGICLTDLIQKYALIEDPIKLCGKVLHIINEVVKIIHKMHTAGFSYRNLRPENVQILVMHHNHNEITIFLDNPDFVWNDNEIAFLSDQVLTDQDFFQYDCLCIGILMVYFFTAIYFLKNKQEQVFFEEFFTFSQVEVEQKLNFMNLPQIIQETIKFIYTLDLKKTKSIEQIRTVLQGIMEKGPQTAFRHDSLSAFLSYHGTRTLKNDKNHVFFKRKNQLHFYEFDSKTFKVIKVFRKKAKYLLKTQISYCMFDNSFYFLATPNSNKVVRVALNTGSKERHIINQKSEVLFYKSIKNMEIEDAQIICITLSDFFYQVYIFSNRNNVDEETNDIYYNSFIINNMYTQQNPGSNDWKEEIQIYEGPRNYLWRRSSFHFYDPHNKFIYCINDSNNIFEKGIRYSYFDTSQQKGDFKEGNLRFACSTEEIYEGFVGLNMHIQSVDYYTEVQHGVFLIHASKNIYICDFNYKCFYSFSSLKQLQNYRQNNANHPRQHQYVYKILNQPFEIKFYNQYNMGSNVTFQSGMLHILGKKEIETVLCSYELFPQQGVMVLKVCKSLQQFEDLLSKIPKDILDITNFQFQQQAKNIQTQKSIFIKQQSTINKSLKDLKMRDKSQSNVKNTNNAIQSQLQTQPLDQIKIVKTIAQTKKYTLYQVLIQDVVYSMRKIKIQQLSDYQNFVILLEQTQQAKHLISIKQCYLEQEEISSSQTQYYAVIIEEYRKMSLNDEIIQRKMNQKPFKPKHVAYILKAVFKTIISLQNISILHGNIQTKFVYYTNREEIKLAGWYLENRREFQSDLLDACSLIFQTAMLLTDENNDFNLTNEILQQNRNKLDEYPGLFQFLNNCLISALHEQDQIDVGQLDIQVKEVYQSLQVKELKELKAQLSSANKRIFWIGYNSNYIITNFYEDVGFCRTDIIQQNQIPYKFSKYNMFSFDGESNMYISGALKEDFKQQTFYSIEFSYLNQSISRLRRLKDIPLPCLSPTLLYLNGWVYCMGGYEINFYGSKHINKKAFRYSVKEDDWEQLADMPFGIVNSSALQNQFGTHIYLFGGISDEIDLARKELTVVVYNIDFDEWNFLVDLSIKSPFVNYRFVKPIVDQIGFDIFLSVQRSSDKIIIRFFELEKGGINLKFVIDDERDKIIKDQIKDQDLFNEHKGHEYYQAFQDDLSMIFVKDTMYQFDEQTKSLIKVIFDNYINIITEKTPCSIIGNEKNDNDYLTYNEDQSNNSFYFNGDYFS